MEIDHEILLSNFLLNLTENYLFLLDFGPQYFTATARFNIIFKVNKGIYATTHHLLIYVELSKFANQH